MIMIHIIGIMINLNIKYNSFDNKNKSFTKLYQNQINYKYYYQ